ncbi:diaminopimelate epimerase [Mesoterricola sediminis]|uniref:Uncharacterized protein n=1 Tax=Mesoterricola sediminis TaxID=2927980 RepID=A0AA48GUQ1_9BACT|nr:hypothetical protein [Mesoterricola sediminis]BDU76589.1 hypothetical protein METESE_15470 [Mesoterricola sediminis]
MKGIFLEPWIPPGSPDPFRLALEAADAAGLARCDAWPRFERGGVTFGGLPPFLTWRVRAGDATHLILVQAREVGALVPGARRDPLPDRWLEDLDLDALARPLAIHPAFPGGASVHVVQVLAPGRARVRSHGDAPGPAIGAVLARLSGLPDWDAGPAGT